MNKVRNHFPFCPHMPVQSRTIAAVMLTSSYTPGLLEPQKSHVVQKISTLQARDLQIEAAENNFGG